MAFLKVKTELNDVILNIKHIVAVISNDDEDFYCALLIDETRVPLDKGQYQKVEKALDAINHEEDQETLCI